MGGGDGEGEDCWSRGIHTETFKSNDPFLLLSKQAN